MSNQSPQNGIAALYRTFLIRTSAAKTRIRRTATALVIGVVTAAMAACGTNPTPQKIVVLVCGSKPTGELSKYTRQSSDYKNIKYQGNNPLLIEAKRNEVIFFKGKKDYKTVEAFRQAMLEQGELGYNRVDEAFLALCEKMEVNPSYEWDGYEREFDDEGSSGGGG